MGVTDGQPPPSLSESRISPQKMKVNLQQPDPITLQREALFDDVWSRPCTQIAAGLGISSSALKRICKAMEVPTPPVGHWAKVQYGKAPTRPKLPKPRPETKLQWQVDVASSMTQKSRNAAMSGQITEKHGADGLQMGLRIQLANNVENLHPLVKATRAHWRESSSRVPWDQRKERKRFNASVAKATEERALIILDCFARNIEAAGFQFLCEKDPGVERADYSYRYAHQSLASGLCWIQAGSERIAFSLREPNRRIKLTPDEAKHSWSQWKDEASGLLEFSLESPWGFKLTTTWKDGKRQRLEERLAEIIFTVQLLGEFKRDEKIRRQQEQERRRIEEERRARVAQLVERMNEQRKREAVALDKAIQTARDWQTAGLLRRYVDAMQATLSENGEILDINCPERVYLEWLRLRADMMDPFAGVAEFRLDVLAGDVPGLWNG